MTASALTPAGTEIGPVLAPGEAGRGDAAALWAPVDLLRHDWARETRLTFAFRTQARRADGDRAQRRGRRTRPIVQAELAFRALAGDDAAALTAALARMAHARSLAPLESERMTLAFDHLAGQAGLVVEDAGDRLLAAGQRVAIAEPEAGRGRAARIEIGLIDAIDGETITLDAGLAAGFPARSRVIPLFEAEPLLAVEPVAALGLRRGAAATFRAARGLGADSALAPLQAAGDWPAGATEHEGFPIIDAAFDARAQRIGFARSGEAGALAGRRARFIFEHAVGGDRQRVRRLTRWHHALAGAQRAAWLAAPGEAFALPAGAASFGGSAVVSVQAISAAARLGPIPLAPGHLAVVRSGAPTLIRRITAAAEVGGLTELTLDAALPVIPAGEIRRLTTAHLVTMGDSLTERWRTTGIGQASARFTETLAEAPLDLNMPDPCPSPLPPPFAGATIACWPASEGDELSVGFGGTTSGFRGVLEGSLNVAWVEVPAVIDAAFLAGVDALWLRHPGARELTEAEQQAVRDWIDAGGVYLAQTEGVRSESVAADQLAWDTIMLKFLTNTGRIKFQLGGLNSGEVAMQPLGAHPQTLNGLFGAVNQWSVGTTGAAIDMARFTIETDDRAQKVCEGNFSLDESGTWVLDPGALAAGSGAVCVMGDYFAGIDWDGSNGSPRDGSPEDISENHDRFFLNFLAAFVPASVPA